MQSHSQKGPTKVTTFVFDLGDVLFTWAPSPSLSDVPPKTLHNILRTNSWFDYERGRLSEAEAYGKVGSEFGIDASSVKKAFELARDSLKSDPAMLDTLRTLKASGYRIYAMSNISAPDWEVLRTKASREEWALFDRVFISAAARARKPDAEFYQHVIAESGLEPAATVFVDDKSENVEAAKEAGLQGIQYKDAAGFIETLSNYITISK
ncbi:HAD-like domain-containing protein [Collybia nuda]|uniref:HAD-like domain-containing protein n=1 Tax=Collybia nuda TaxID=64659 RepID=A0A9P5YEX6_9AGAR|nr:HAD-like domain-containing protein [Collybia nuda]